MSKKQVAQLLIGTNDHRYTFIIPNIGKEQLEALLMEAQVKASERNTQLREMKVPFIHIIYLFEFENETVEVCEEPLFIHRFIKEEVYAYDTPTVRVTNR
jgi:hypothetical protein